MAKYLSKGLRKIIPPFEITLRNSKECLDTLNKRFPNSQILPNVQFFSLDVINMFPSIPPSYALEALRDILDKLPETLIRHELDMASEQCITMIEKITTNNYFKYKEEIYINPNGLAMGSSLSPLLADVAINKLEIQILKKFEESIIQWKRYIDDVISACDTTQTSPEVILEFANQLHPKIKFTLEVEKEAALNYLDFTIDRSQKKLQTRLLKKETGGDSVLDNNSALPAHTKLNTAYQELRRIIALNSNKDCLKQKRKFRQTLIRLNYTEKQITTVFKKGKNVDRVEKGTEIQTEQVKYIPFQFQSLLEPTVNKLVDNVQHKIAWRNKNKIVSLYKSRVGSHNNTAKKVWYILSPVNVARRISARRADLSR